MIHDARASNALKMIEKLGKTSLLFASRTALVMDHHSPSQNVEVANIHIAMRKFSDAHAKGVRMIATPASRQIYLAAMREGLFEILTMAGVPVEAAGCGACATITRHVIPGDKQVVISSANRNFKGRLGNPTSEIWIASAATVAASALTGYVTDPREYVAA